MLRDARLVQAAGPWQCLCSPALVCSVGPGLEQLQLSRLGVLERGELALKGAELPNRSAGQMGNATILMGEDFWFCSLSALGIVMHLS